MSGSRKYPYPPPPPQRKTLWFVPSTPKDFPFQGGLWWPPPSPQEFPEFFNGTSLTIIWKYGRILLQQCSVNVCYAYYSAKLLASSPSRLQIMSVLFLGKLVSLNIRVAKFKHRLFYVFVLTPIQHYEENLSFTHVNNFANDSKKNPETYNVPFWLVIYLHILSVSSGWLFKSQKLHGCP